MDKFTEKKLLEALEMMKVGECPPIVGQACKAPKDYCKNKQCWAEFVQGVVIGNINFTGPVRNDPTVVLH